MSSDKFQHSNALNSFVLPDLPPSVLEALPPLPRISDPDLLRVATTHASVSQKIRARYDLSMSDEILDYEKLEHVGDAILGSIVTVLLHDMFPMLREGPATMLKTHLISNRTLAQIAAAYGLPKKLIAAPSALYATREQVKTRGSMLEAWIAAVFYSYLNDTQADTEGPGEAKGHDARTSIDDAPAPGSARTVEEVTPAESVAVSPEPMAAPVEPEVNNPSKDPESSSSTQENAASNQSAESTPESQVASTTESDIREGQEAEPGNSILKVVLPFMKALSIEPMERTSTTLPSSLTRADDNVSTSKARSRGDAYLHVDKWLRPLFEPVAHFALDEMRKEQARLQSIPESSLLSDDRSCGAAALIQVHCSRFHWPEPVTKSVRGAGDSWVSTCRVTDGDGKVWTASATRMNKKSGVNVAAYEVAKQMGLLQEEQD